MSSTTLLPLAVYRCVKMGRLWSGAVTRVRAAVGRMTSRADPTTTTRAAIPTVPLKIWQHLRKQPAPKCKDALQTDQRLYVVRVAAVLFRVERAGRKKVIPSTKRAHTSSSKNMSHCKSLVNVKPAQNSIRILETVFFNKAWQFWGQKIMPSVPFPASANPLYTVNFYEL